MSEGSGLIFEADEHRRSCRDDIDAVVAGEECVVNEPIVIPDAAGSTFELGDQGGILDDPEGMREQQFILIGHGRKPVALIRVRVEESRLEPHDDDPETTLFGGSQIRNPSQSS